MNKALVNGAVKDVKSGEKFSTATIEVTNPNGRTKSYIRVIAPGKMAQELKEGAYLIEGRIQTGSYTNKDGETVYTTDLVATSIEKSNSTVPLNVVVAHGRLVRDPSVKAYTGKDGAEGKVARDAIALDRFGKKTEGQPTADFPSVVAFGSQAEFMEKYLHKGSEVVLDGRLQSNSYEKDGKKVYTTDVIINHVEFAGPKTTTTTTTAPAETAEPTPTADDGFVPAEAEYEGEDCLPFN